jgi:hypothetical protein
MATPAENHFSSKPCSNVHIGHASTSNPGSGVAADEVLISNFYTSLEHNIVLRPKTRELAERSAAACEAGCSNNKIEYSQSSRNTLYTQAKQVNYQLGNITTTCYADCSSFMTVCAIAGGAHISYGSGAPNCGTMSSRFEDSGDYDVLKVAENTSLKSADYLKRGDILVRDWFKNGSRHTVMVLDNGAKIPAAGNGQADYFAIKVALDITEIGTESVSVTAEITKIENGEEKVLKSASGLNEYKWTYELTSFTGAGKKLHTKKLQISSSTMGFSLDNLTPGKSYALKITAKEKNGEAEFSSPSVIFTTVSEQAQDRVTAVEFKNINTNTRNCKAFIKINNTFKRVILHNI